MLLETLLDNRHDIFKFIRTFQDNLDIFSSAMIDSID